MLWSSWNQSIKKEATSARQDHISIVVVADFEEAGFIQSRNGKKVLFNHSTIRISITTCTRDHTNVYLYKHHHDDHDDHHPHDHCDHHYNLHDLHLAIAGNFAPVSSQTASSTLSLFQQTSSSPWSTPSYDHDAHDLRHHHHHMITIIAIIWSL